MNFGRLKKSLSFKMQRLMKFLAAQFQIKQGLMDLIFQYSPRWFTLMKFFAIYALMTLLSQILLDFSINYEKTISNSLVSAFVSYTLVLIPSLIILYYAYSKKKNLNIQKYKQINSIFSTITTTFILIYWLFKISDRTSSSEIINNNLEIFIGTHGSCVLYLIFWVLIPIAQLKVMILVLHHTVLIVFVMFFLKADAFYIVKTLFAFAFISVILGVYSSFRDKQLYDSFWASQQKDSIQEDWKKMVNDFPNGVVLVSLEKKIQYVNKNVVELFQLNQDERMMVSSINKTTTPIKNKETFMFEKAFDSERIYNVLVERIGIIEEVNPDKDNADTVNLELNYSDGFSSIEPSEFALNSLKTKGRKSVKVTANKAISSNSFPRKSHTSAMKSTDFLSLRSQDISPVIFGDRMPQIPNFCQKKEGTNTMKVDLTDVEITLDHVINKLRKKIVKHSKNIQYPHELKTYCTRYKNFKDHSHKTKTKYELKIKPIEYRNEIVLLILIQDVSYLEIVQELRENSEYKTKVLTTLSHELRTPLNGALNPLEKLIKDKKKKENYKENEEFKDLNIVLKSLMILQSVLNDVVDFALINSNQFYLNYETKNHFEFFQEILDIFSQQIQEKNLELSLIIDQRSRIPKTFKTDFERLGQILVSLLNNSIKNTFSGSIKVKLEMVKKLTNSPKNSRNRIKTKKSLTSMQSSPKSTPKNHGDMSFGQAILVSMVENDLNLNKFREDTEKNPTNLSSYIDKTPSRSRRKPMPAKERFANKPPSIIIKVTVADTGTGIEETQLESIKKGLSSVDVLEVCVGLNRKKGCGLGLTISHCLALLIGPPNNQGLTVQSEFGKGTEVTFFFEGFTEKEDELSLVEEMKFESSFVGSSSNIISRTSIRHKNSHLSMNNRRTERNKSESFTNITFSKAPQLIAKAESVETFSGLGKLKGKFEEIDKKSNDSDEGNHISMLMKKLSLNLHKHTLSEKKMHKFDSFSQEHYFNNRENQEDNENTSNINNVLNSDNILLQMSNQDKESISAFEIINSTPSENNNFNINFGSFNNNNNGPSIMSACNCNEVLIVDDDAFNLLALEKNLKTLQIKSIKAYNGQQAIDILKNKQRCNDFCPLFSLIILDYHMPIKNGLETAIEISQMVKTQEIPNIPVVGCTAFGAKDLVEQWKNAGVVDILIKPLKLDKLENFFREWKFLG